MAATPRDESGWTIETYSAHNEALRIAQEKLETERDRRYAEVAVEREKALRIKEEADKRALDLQAETQAYKDEKANELRSQIERERGLYVQQGDLRGAVDKIEATIKPLSEFVTGQQGRREGIGTSVGILYAVALVSVAIISAVILYATHHSTTVVHTVTVTVPTK